MDKTGDKTRSRLRESIRVAQWRLSDLERFTKRFPPLPEPQPCLPRITWDQLERQLIDLSACPSGEVKALLTPLKSAEAGKPAELLLRELLIVISILLDEAPRQDGEGGSIMT
jgi:hypothetical protein